jgi:hypothetical protein
MTAMGGGFCRSRGRGEVSFQPLPTIPSSQIPKCSHSGFSNFFATECVGLFGNQFPFGNKTSKQTLSMSKVTVLGEKSPRKLPYSTVTDLAKFRGLSTSVPLAHAV